jgi:uncharacterized protein (TIGR00730 family)
MKDTPLVAVFGSSTLAPQEPGYELAARLGAALARAGAVAVTGGYSGAMEAVSKGAVEAGGEAVGVTVELFEKRGPANRYLTKRIHTSDLHERLRWLVSHCRGFIVLPGSIGTLTELFLTWNLISAGGRPHAPIVLLGGEWPAVLAPLHHPDYVAEPLFRYVTLARGPEEAARLSLADPSPAPAAEGARP